MSFNFPTLIMPLLSCLSPLVTICLPSIPVSLFLFCYNSCVYFFRFTKKWSHTLFVFLWLIFTKPWFIHVAANGKIFLLYGWVVVHCVHACDNITNNIFFTTSKVRDILFSTNVSRKQWAKINATGWYFIFLRMFTGVFEGRILIQDLWDLLGGLPEM